jgi:hypothetical protein
MHKLILKSKKNLFRYFIQIYEKDKDKIWKKFAKLKYRLCKSYLITIYYYWPK